MGGHCRLCIDIGGSTVRAAVIEENGNLREIDIGTSGFPAYLAITKSEEILIGEEAKTHSVIEPGATLSKIKYLFYQNLNMITLPFLLEKRGDQVHFHVRCNGRHMAIPSHLIYGAFIVTAKKRVEEILEHRCSTVVVTTPPDFTAKQIAAVEKVARSAGFLDVVTQSENTAAVNYFYHMRNLMGEQLVLLCNFGASSSEIAFLKVFGKDSTIIRRQRLVNITGDSLDERIFRHCVSSVNPNTEIDPRDIQHLRWKCEQARIALSTKREFTVNVDNLLCTTVTKDLIENLDDLWLALKNTVTAILKEADPGKIVHVVLTGGVSRTPKIKQVIQECIRGVNAQITTNVQLCNNAVVFGGALRAKDAFPEEDIYHETTGPSNIQGQIWSMFKSASEPSKPLCPKSPKPPRSIDSGTASEPGSSMNSDPSSTSKVFAHIANELLESERKFVDDLRFVVNDCMKHFQGNDRVPPSLVGKRPLIFANWETIYRFHEGIFLVDMESRELTPSAIGELFCEYEQDFEAHAEFCRIQIRSTRQQIIADADSFLKTKNVSIPASETGLTSYLSKPFKRLVAYRSILDRIIKETPIGSTDHADLRILQAASDKMDFFLHHGNDLAYQDLIRHHSIPLNQQGRLLRQNEMMVTEGSKPFLRSLPRRRIFLFEKIIIFTKLVQKSVEPDNCLKFKRGLKTDEIGLTENPNGSKTAFKIWFGSSTNPANAFELEAENEVTKQLWVKDINRILEGQRQQMRTPQIQHPVLTANDHGTTWPRAPRSPSSENDLGLLIPVNNPVPGPHVQRAVSLNVIQIHDKTAFRNELQQKLTLRR